MMEDIKRIRQTMTSSIFEVFEKMFYIFLEPRDTRYDGYDMRTDISFEGTISGHVIILFSKEIARGMVQNMLGLEDGDIPGKVIEDCSKEATNMVCGNFLSRLYNTQLFNLSVPTFTEYKSENLESGDDICRMDFDSDNGRMGVMVKV